MHLENCHSNEHLRAGDDIILPRNDTVCCILGPNQKLEFKLLRITEEVLAEDPRLGDARSHASDLALKGHTSLLT